MSILFDNTYARLCEAFALPVMPTPVAEPELIRRNDELAAELGLESADLSVDVLSGNTIPTGAEPVAQAYSGHQFGHFNPQLGDGRAILLGEVVDTSGTRRDIQLKGAGPTPFSRCGDGRSALGPVLREYLVSEAMHALGVPTTRALAAVASGEKVYRETMQPGGVFARVAQSHIRVGTFQWFAARRDFENLRLLADYTIDRHYPEAKESETPYLVLLRCVVERQADLVAQWMQIGFIHGVMNTDNFSVRGETIDYGPCAFLDEYHPDKVFSSIDRRRRYAFANQAPIAQWNLARFAETLLPVWNGKNQKKTERRIDDVHDLLESFRDRFEAAWSRRLAAKIGMVSPDSGDNELAQSLLEVMAEQKADFTLTFRHLSTALTGEAKPFCNCFRELEAVTPWLERWRNRLKAFDRKAIIETMQTSNPVFIPRNHRIEEVISAAYRGDFAPFHRLHEVLQAPFTEQPEHAQFEKPPAASEVVCETFCGT